MLYVDTSGLDCDLDAGECTLEDLNCYQTYNVQLLQEAFDTPPLLNFQFGGPHLVSPWQCPGECLADISEADENDAWNGATLFATEFRGNGCACAYQVADGQKIAASDNTVTIRPC